MVVNDNAARLIRPCFHAHNLRTLTRMSVQSGADGHVQTQYLRLVKLTRYIKIKQLTANDKTRLQRGMHIAQSFPHLF